MLFWSSAITVKLKAEPAIAVAGAEIVKCVAGPALTAMLDEVPVMEPVTESVAEIVWPPAVFSVAGNVPVPLVKVADVGSTANPSLLANCTTPSYPVTMLLSASSAVTVKLNDAPAVTGDCSETVKCVAGPEEFVTEAIAKL